mmetsp:Transcript_167971/g.539470  ORF Transcript_167971/g.539470 Transcript_167971/m.539470 type:complete len:132 (+) Transcript_167971:6-401(+)
MRCFQWEELDWGCEISSTRFPQQVGIVNRPASYIQPFDGQFLRLQAMVIGRVCEFDFSGRSPRLLIECDVFSGRSWIGVARYPLHDFHSKLELSIGQQVTFSLSTDSSFGCKRWSLGACANLTSVAEALVF